MTLFDFSDAHASQPWHAIDDRVMGGISQSELIAAHHQQQSLGLFRGEVSRRNNGGFCSVRADLDKPITQGVEHLWIECQNNNQWGEKTYYLNLRTSNSFDGISYRAGFTPDQHLSRYQFCANEFSPVFRGRAVPDAPALQFTAVRQLGLMIADAQVGLFELFIKNIGVS